MTDSPSLVWTPAGTLGRFAGLPDDVARRLDVRELPRDPLTHPDLARLGVFIAAPTLPQTHGRATIRKLLESAPSLHYVQSLTSGVDWILDDVPDGIPLCSVRGAFDEPMAEFLLAGILACTKDLHVYAAAPAAPAAARPGRRLEGATVLFVGYGSIARRLEALLSAFHVHTLRVARTARPDEGVEAPAALPELLPQADVIVLLLPLTPETRGFADVEFFARTKPGALFVNGGRGATVDTEALAAAVRDRCLRAFLDVTDPEPLPADHPLRAEPRVLITPHIGALSADPAERCFAVVTENLTRFARDEPLVNRVANGY